MIAIAGKPTNEFVNHEFVNPPTSPQFLQPKHESSSWCNVVTAGVEGLKCVVNPLVPQDAHWAQLNNTPFSKKLRLPKCSHVAKHTQHSWNHPKNTHHCLPSTEKCNLAGVDYHSRCPKRTIHHSSKVPLPPHLQKRATGQLNRGRDTNRKRGLNRTSDCPDFSNCPTMTSDCANECPAVAQRLPNECQMPTAAQQLLPQKPNERPIVAKFQQMPGESLTPTIALVSASSPTGRDAAIQSSKVEVTASTIASNPPGGANICRPPRAESLQQCAAKYFGLSESEHTKGQKIRGGPSE
ncbi:unnamed protein product [Calypogeia fissa]